MIGIKSEIVNTKTAFQRLVHQIGGSEAWHIYHLVKTVN